MTPPKCEDTNCDMGWVGYTYTEEKQNRNNGEVTVTPIEREAVRPCKDCDPERYEIWFTSTDSREYYRRLQSRSHSKKLETYQEGERDKTRTL